MKTFLLVIAVLLYSSTHQASANSIPEGMVQIEKGCFMMGTNTLYDYLSFYKDIQERPNDRERPAHKVCLDSFYLDTHEVTQSKWENMKFTNNSVYKGPQIAVNQIEWNEARKYCNKQGYRLPTEAEWEYAAKAGTTSEYPWGNKINRSYLWYGGNSGSTHHPVGTRKPNQWGLYDMLGGVWEWVEDWYEEFYYKNSPKNNPKGPTHILSWHVIRGGSWIDDQEFVRTTIRYPGMADNTEDYWVGFRCAQSIL